MTIYYQDATVMVHAGDCLDVLVELPDNSVDSVCTDPPYSYAFMGRAWDSHPTPAAYQAWCQLWAAECLRVLRPGGHLVAFGGTRTAHRLTAAIEDAGFEIRDSIAWLYGSGFPKSLDVSKAIDRAAGAEREVTGRHPWAHVRGDGSATTTDLYDGGATGRRGALDVTAPATDDAATWQGWGTALKPAHEPITVARKPLAGTVAANVLRYGTGALNVDACRIGTTPTDLAAMQGRSGARTAGDLYPSRGDGQPWEPATAGRWPPNVALDTTQAAALDQQTGELTSGLMRAGTRPIGERNTYGQDAAAGYETTRDTPGDMGGASRFFYTSKASTTERIRMAAPDADPELFASSVRKRCTLCGKQEVNMPGSACSCPTPDFQPDPSMTGHIAHPTVKPLDLMRWLVRLVTPPAVSVCDWCDNRRYASTKADGEAEVVSDLRRDIPGEGQPAAAEVLLEGVRSGRNEVAAEDVRAVRDNVPTGRGQAEVLLEEVRGTVDGPGEAEPGGAEVAQRLRTPTDAGPSDGDPSGLPVRAPDGGSSDVGPDADLRRSSAPPERDQGRQPTGEPRGSTEGDPRPHPQASTQANHLPPLPREDRRLRSCPTCGGPLTSRPGLVLDPFAGSGTTVEAAILEGFRCTAIEREPTYLPLITQRVHRRRDPVAYIRAAGEDLGLFGLDGEVPA